MPNVLLYPAAGFVVLAKSLDPTAMLEAMRLGITEWLPDPVRPGISTPRCSG